MQSDATQLTADEIGRLINPPVALTPAAVAELDATERAIAQAVGGSTDRMLRLLEAAVNINSGSANAAGIGRVAELFEAEFKQLEFETEIIPPGLRTPELGGDGATTLGPHLVARHRGARGRPVFLNGHLDTVWPEESEFQRFSRDATHAYGPGCQDMKNGIVIMLEALRALAATGNLEGRAVRVVIIGDEEVGSLHSRPIIEAEARACRHAMIFEPSSEIPLGALVIQRKGLGQGQVDARGRRAHGAGGHHLGLSALRHVMRVAEAFEDLTDYPRGVTTSVGMLATGPGASFNTVPGDASCTLDFRFWDDADGEAVIATVREIVARTRVTKPWTDGATQAELWAMLTRPAMPRTPERDAWAAEILGLGARLGIPVAVAGSAGGADTNFLHLIGVIGIDGFGAIGSGGHTPDERIEIASLEARAKLAALTLHRAFQREG